MKKSLVLSLVLCAVLVSCSSTKVVPSQEPDKGEYYVRLCDGISVGTSRAFECVAVIAFLSGFKEYTGFENSGMYESYFDDYRKNKDVKKAVRKFKYLNFTRGFSYDAVASLGTYLESDCHSYRVSKDILLKNLDSRIADSKIIDDLLVVVSRFYDATNFGKFYERNKIVYQRLAQKYIDEKDYLQEIVDNYVAYYHQKPNEIRISSSFVTGHGNYGMNFKDGNTQFFEPKFCVQYSGLDANLIVHEISHPVSNPVAEVIFKNEKITSSIEKTMVSDKLGILESMAYGNTYTYIIELLNRANTIVVCEQFLTEAQIKSRIDYDKNQCRFDEIEEIIEILEDYKKGDYETLMDFAPELERRWAEIY